MNLRTTAILLVCLLVLGGLFLMSRGSGTETPRQPGAVQPLVTGDLVAVSVSFGGRAYELQRGQDGWFQSTPVWFPLRREAGQRWEWAAQDLKPQETLDLQAAGAPTLGDLSLDPPTATVELITANGAHRFDLGDQTVSGPGYLRTDRGEVVVVPPALHELVYRDKPESWYADRLPTPELSTLRTVVIRRDSETVGLHRTQRGWSLDVTRWQRVNPDLLAALDGLLAHTPPKDTVPRTDGDPRRPYGLTSPRVTMTFHGSGDDTYELRLGRSAPVEGGGVFAELTRNDTPGPVLVLPAEAATLLNWPTERLRDPRLFEAERAEVVSLAVAHAEQFPIEVKDAGAGLVFADETIEGSPDALVDAVLNRRSASHAAGFQTSDHPEVLLTVRWGVTQEAKAALFRDGDRWVAKRTDEDDVYVLRAETVEPLLTLLERPDTAAEGAGTPREP